MTKKYVYLDNAATTFPKPPSVLSAMAETYGRIGVSPGRGSYDLASEAEIFVEEARRKLALFFGAPDPNGVIFASNATDALNLAIQGILETGDHVISTRLEHNSVLRPLHHLREQGMIEYDLVRCDGKGFIDPDEVSAAVRSNTKLVILNHASNVLGTIQPIREIGRVCAEKEITLLVDAAQSAGVVPIDMEESQIAAIAFTGHKGLLGPTGIGGLIIRPELKIRTTRFGGTGVDSKSPIHTQTLPHRLEAGTLNLLGIIGLSAALEFLDREGIDAIHMREMGLLARLRDGLSTLDRIEIYNAEDLSDHVALLTTNVMGMDPSDVGAILDGDFGIAVRVGLHCAPLVHETIGTFPNGGVRFSMGPFNTDEEIDSAIQAMAEIAQSR
ncbi:MAG: aminotransferase class V-fold PLP-dependent enzyme [Desulfobacteraceae bacterium]|nr:MAG: aminotransferase class V-fold PLP-dependent enzyme [Desulfobacteraceae bacterium]